MQANAGHTWDQIRAQLAIRFSNVPDAQIALSLLRQVKKNQGKQFKITLKEYCLWLKKLTKTKGETLLKDS